MNKKWILLSTFAFFFVIQSLSLTNAELYFNSTWNTSATSSGSSNSSQVILPLYSEGTYAFDVNWGDNNTDYITTYNQAEINHTYTLEGVYNISINGTISGWKFANTGDKEKILDIFSWGPLQVGDEGGYQFRGCSNLNVSATDALNITGTNLVGMFYDADNFNGDISNWDVSSVTHMSYMFDNADKFNQNLSGWDVSNVINMNFMFYEVDVFNGDISDWDVSSVTHMIRMFAGAREFNQDIGGWDVSNVTDMNFMLYYADKFNQNLSDWDVSKVDDMSFMFAVASIFNGNISNWDVSSVIRMDSMFNGAQKFNQDISGWNVSKVTRMESMLRNTYVFNQDISGWNVSNVADMRYMFQSSQDFNQKLNDWDVSNVGNMSYMFAYAYDFNGNISDWDVSNVTDMSYIFYNSVVFNQDISGWNVSKVTDMGHVFFSAYNFNQNISGWNVSNVTDMDYMFANARDFNNSIADWDVSKVEDMRYMFSGADNFNQDISGWDVSNVTTMRYMFYSADDFDQDISGWNVSKVTRMDNMFELKQISVINYENILINWSQLNVQNDTIFHGGTSNYRNATAGAAKAILIDTYNWTITDSGALFDRNITFSSSTFENNTRYSLNYITINAVSSDSNNLENIIIYIYNTTSGALVSSNSSTSGDFTWTTENLPEGNYTFNATAILSYENVTSETRTVTLISPLSIDIIYPTSDVSVNQNNWFNVTLNVSCRVGFDCGTVNVSLDPISGCDPSLGASGCTDTCSDMYNSSLMSDFEGESWTYADEIGGYCDMDGMMYTITSDACGFFESELYEIDLIGVGQCTYFEGYYCPSYERLGSAVTAEDCLPSDEPEEMPEIFNLDHAFFTGEGEAVAKGGLISTNSSVTPFWTNKSSNPYTVNLSEDISQLVTFWVNATGAVSANYTFFAFANKTDEMNIHNTSASWVVTLVSANTDTDNDGVADVNDTLEGNESNVNVTGISKLNITVGSNSTNGTYNNIHEVAFYNASTKLLNFTHNFSTSEIDLSKITIIKAENSIIVNLSEQVQEIYNKTLYVEDNNFASLCVKDDEIASISEVSSGCDGTNETDFTSCLGNTDGITLNGITCTDEGNVIKIDNLRHSAIRGTTTTTDEEGELNSSGSSDDMIYINHILKNESESPIIISKKYPTFDKSLKLEKTRNDTLTWFVFLTLLIILGILYKRKVTIFEKINLSNKIKQIRHHHKQRKHLPKYRHKLQHGIFKK